MIWSNNSVSPRAGNKAWCCSNSALFGLKRSFKLYDHVMLIVWYNIIDISNFPKTHPADHMSIADECVLEPNKISGARYHRVTTFGVDGCFGFPKVRDKPKSASFSIPPSKLKIRLWKRNSRIHTGHKKIGDFEITMNNKLWVNMSKSFEHLNYQTFYLRF